MFPDVFPSLPRLQAKTRAVKLIRQTMSKKVIGVTQQILRGHEGALCLAEMMRGPLMEHATVFSGGKRFIAFAARARAGHEQVGGLRGANRPSSGAVNEAGEFSGPEGQNLFSGLESLASAATMSLDDDKQWKGSGDGEGAVGRCKGPQLSQRRLCELCGKGNEGSYGTGRFCSKACRFEALAPFPSRPSGFLSSSPISRLLRHNVLPPGHIKATRESCILSINPKRVSSPW